MKILARFWFSLYFILDADPWGKLSTNLLQRGCSTYVGILSWYFYEGAQPFCAFRIPLISCLKIISRYLPHWTQTVISFGLKELENRLFKYVRLGGRPWRRGTNWHFLILGNSPTGIQILLLIEWSRDASFDMTNLTELLRVSLCFQKRK